MHSNKFRDPLISRAQPVTIMTPVVEETLRLAGVQPHREQMLDRFMTGHPRIAVVHGSEDHPPESGFERNHPPARSRRSGRTAGFRSKLSQSFPCEELVARHGGNALCAAGAKFLHGEPGRAHGSPWLRRRDRDRCLRQDDGRQHSRARSKRTWLISGERRRPVFAMLIPSLIGRETFVTDEEKRQVRAPCAIGLSETERQELEELLQRPLKPNVYAQVKAVARSLFPSTHRPGKRKGRTRTDRWPKCAAVPGANCACIRSIDGAPDDAGVARPGATASRHFCEASVR